MARRVAIIGTGQTKYTTKRTDVSVAELAREAAVRALRDADLTFNDIDAIVFGNAPEAFEGVSSPERWAVDAVGAKGKPFFRVHTGGATGGSAALAAFHHVETGDFENVLVVALQRVGQTPSAQRILATIWEPLYAKGFSLNLIIGAAMGMRRTMEAVGYTEEHVAMISSKCHRDALRNPYAHLQLDVSPEDVLNSRLLCWPLRVLDCCPRSDGACAIVVTSGEQAAKRKEAAWVHGYGAESLQGSPGERAPRWDEVEGHLLQTYKMAGITAPRQQIQVVEPYMPFAPGEITLYASMGFAPLKDCVSLVEKGFGAYSGEIPFSPSGGVLCSNPIGATALVRVAESAAQVLGRAGAHQVRDVNLALGTGAGGSPAPGSSTFLNSFILGRNAPE